MSLPAASVGHGANTLVARCRTLSAGVQNDLGVALDALIELFVCMRRLLQRDLVRYDEACLGSSGNDQFAHLAVIALDFALPRSDTQTLLEHLADRHQQQPLLGAGVWPAGVGW